MDRKERVCAYIASKEYIPLKLDELMAVLDVPAEDIDELQRILDELLADGRIYLTKKQRYMPCESEKNTVKGRLSCNARGFFGFVVIDDDEDVFVKGEDMNGALNGDTVVVKIDSKPKNGRREGRVIRITERANAIVVGVFTGDDSKYYHLRPDNKRLYAKIRVNPYEMMDAEIGDRAAVEITGYRDDHVFGRVISVLGPAESLKSYIEGIIIEHDIEQEFDAGTLEEVEKVPDEVTEASISGRLDLRDKFIFTIDGDNARDFDDAVSLDILDNGNYSLGVHIADVTHYVKENSQLDSEAFLRGTSVYLADRVIPMLPEKLSNGICSLRPNEDRLTLSVIMEIDKNGKVISQDIEKSVINSKERMTYNNVTKLLEGDPDLEERYGYMLPVLKNMRELAEILEHMRSVRGAIDFDFPETSVLVDENSEPLEIVLEERGIANKIIEQFMLTANETVAEYAYWSELPFVYRTHEPPSEDKINAFNHFISHFGLLVKGKIDKDNPVHPKELQKILEEVKDTPEERMVASTMLHSLMKAEYKPENLGHFGLSAKYYCHFTSPIRRYPDLIIHRILKEFMDNGISDARRSYYAGFTSKAAKHSSETEMNAEYAERDVDDLLKTAYMAPFVGSEFTGTISNITSFGMFIELENTVEGLIRVENMNEDYFIFDEMSSSLVGEKTGVTYRIGDEVDIMLMRVDVMLRQIDFVLSHDASANVIKKFRRMAEPRRVNRNKSAAWAKKKRRRRNGKKRKI